MYQSNRIMFNPLSSIDSTTFTGDYLLLGTIPNPARIIKIINDSTVDVTISTDGIEDMDFVSAGNFILYDFGTNRGTSADALDLPIGAIYVSGSAGTGSVYLTSLSAVTQAIQLPGV